MKSKNQQSVSLDSVWKNFEEIRIKITDLNFFFFFFFLISGRLLRNNFILTQRYKILFLREKSRSFRSYHESPCTLLIEYVCVYVVIWTR